MKTHRFIFLAMLMAGLIPSLASSQQEKISLESHLNCPAVSTAGGRVYLRLSIATRPHHRPERRPVNLCIVLDRSGSMREESKMNYAKAALSTLIDQLRGDDVFSLVIYDDVVEVVRSAGRVGHDKERIRSLVDEIEPRGWTNLCGGMQEGFRQVEIHSDEEYVNRVILLSDGLANQGITDPRRLEQIARRERERSISLSTIGVGLAYNENLMVGLSENGGGNYYFLESSRNLASVLRREFDRLGEVMVQNVIIELKLGRGVQLLDAIGYDHHADGPAVQVPIGDLYAGENREVILELNVPPGDGSVTLARGRLTSSGKTDGIAFGSFASGITYEASLADVERQRDLSEQAKADVAVSTRNVARAMEALDRGDKNEATRVLSATGNALMASPAAASVQGGAVITEQLDRIKGYADTLQAEGKDAGRAKKAIQYENYRQQKRR
ncbi:MAG: VWA domain-containing protein [Bacteroidota bacterium]